MNRSLDEMSASELTKAIDDTNFPKTQSFQSLSATPISESDQVFFNRNGFAGRSSMDNDNGNDENGALDTDSNPSGFNGTTGFMRRNHPTPLKMVAFKQDSLEVNGTPRTPRTSTTPGSVRTLDD